MKKEERIKKNYQFRFLYNRGKSCSNQNLVIYYFRNNKGLNRIGITVSKKIGKAVVRNRIKRYIREGFRINKSRFKKGFDIIFVARGNARKVSFHDIENSIMYLMNKGGLLKKGE